MYGARFVHTAENEKQLRARNLSYAAMLDWPTIAEIKALGAEVGSLQRRGSKTRRHGHGFF